MTFQQFLETYNGQFVERGGSENAKNQCVDLANAYLEEVLGQPKILWTNACDFPLKVDKSKFDIIPNTEDGIMQEGDIFVYGKSSSMPYGHIGVCISATLNTFVGFEQNYPTGTNCHVQQHRSYAGVSCWLRFKESQKIILPPNLAGELYRIIAQREPENDQVTQNRELIELSRGLRVEVDNLITQLRQRITELENTVTPLTQQIKDMQGQLDGYKDQVKSWEDFQDELWFKLNPIGKSKNQASILSEITELIAKEDNYEETIKASQLIESKYKTFIDTIKETIGTPEMKEDDVLGAVLSLVGTKQPIQNEVIEPKKPTLIEILLNFIKQLLERSKK